MGNDGGRITFVDDTFSLTGDELELDINVLNISASGFLLSSTAPSMSIGNPTPNAYNAGNGFFVDGQGRFLVGSGSGDRIQYDGSNLIMSSSEFMMGNLTSAFISGSEGNLEISSSNFHLQAEGDVTMSGRITAAGGTIAGWTLNDDRFFAGSDASSTYIALIPGTGFQMGDETFDDAPFSVTNTGVLKATSGTIGGFTLGTNTLTATNFTIDPSGKSITLGSGTDIFVVDGDIGLNLGDSDFAQAPFSVTKAGVLKAESGTVGGWTLSSDTIVGSNLTLM